MCEAFIPFKGFLNPVPGVAALGEWLTSGTFYEENYDEKTPDSADVRILDMPMGMLGQQ